jgi:uncharacterized membrane protein
MSTLNDWQDRFSRLSDNILQLQTFVQASVQNNRSTGDLISAVDDLKRRKAVLEAKEKDYEQKASTADREFLERKSEFPDPFYPDKLYTLQDFTLFFFFVSYIVFIVALVLTVRQKMGLILSIGLIVLVLVFAIIMRYA